jgi:hypothetical protein
MSAAVPIDDARAERGLADDPRQGDARGLVLAVGGVGGLDFCGIALRYVLAATRLPHAIQLVRWGHGFGRWHADLTDAANHEAAALLIAATVRGYKSGPKDGHVFVVAKSGGAGVAVKALELLDEQSVERAVLLAPALSPGYDLTRALRAVRSEIVVFWSPLDLLVLGAGTRWLGTIDRLKTVSAGLVGFQVPPEEARSREYGKLRQVRWHPGMAATGYFGGHWGPDSPWFLKKYVVPLLRLDKPTPS